jgi:2'-5' RNA ligase
VRLFVAVYPSPAAIAHLADAVAALHVGRASGAGINARLAAPQTWHVTLAFIGEVADPDRAAEAVGAAVAGWELPIELAVHGGGTFGRGRFTVLWTGLAGGVPVLHALATVVRRRLRKARVPYDRKPLRPHLTIARPGDRLPADQIKADKASLSRYQGPSWPVTSVRLVRSEPGPRPAYHTVLDAAL